MVWDLLIIALTGLGGIKCIHHIIVNWPRKKNEDRTNVNADK